MYAKISIKVLEDTDHHVVVGVYNDGNSTTVFAVDGSYRIGADLNAIRSAVGIDAYDETLRLAHQDEYREISDLDVALYKGYATKTISLSDAQYKLLLRLSHASGNQTSRAVPIEQLAADDACTERPSTPVPQPRRAVLRVLPPVPR